MKFIIGRITIFDKKIYALVSLALIFGYGGLLINGLLAKPKGPEKVSRKILLSWLMTPFLVSWMASTQVPNFQPFRLLLILPAFFLILGQGIISLSGKGRLLALFFVFLVNLGSLLAYYQNPYFYREDWRALSNFVKDQKVFLVISAKAFAWPLTYYRVESQVISVTEDLCPVKSEDFLGFNEKLKNQFLISYTPYLADVYDPTYLVPKWIQDSGFVKIKEISFNQIPVWVYERSDQ